jgi:hypothetical protein
MRHSLGDIFASDTLQVRPCRLAAAIHGLPRSLSKNPLGMPPLHFLILSSTKYN